MTKKKQQEKERYKEALEKFSPGNLLTFVKPTMKECAKGLDLGETWTELPEEIDFVSGDHWLILSRHTPKWIHRTTKCFVIMFLFKGQVYSTDIYSGCNCIKNTIISIPNAPGTGNDES